MLKELLCIPYGGLNDTLVQIAKCYEYAESYKRRHLIDTSRSGIFLDFGLYFELNPQLDCKVTTVINDDIFDRLNSCLSVKPFEFKGMIRDVALRHVTTPEYKGYTFSTSGKPTSFDFSSDHMEDLLIHLNCGGGIASHSLIPCLRITQRIQGRILSYLSSLPLDYIAFHIRNTDIKTDFITLFKATAPNLRGRNVLVCSDDSHVIAAAKDIFVESTIYSNDKVYYTSGHLSLHSRENYRDLNEMDDATIVSLCDLFALAFSSQLIIAKHRGNWYSGFSRLAYELFQNKEMSRMVLGVSLI